jgi:hypothetical protein
MMTCPQCKQQVSWKSLWTLSGLARVVCPHCHASLCPEARCAIVLFVVSFGLGDAALVLLRRQGAEFLVALAGFFLVFAAVYALLAPAVLRLKLKERDGGAEPHLTGRSA